LIILFIFLFFFKVGQKAQCQLASAPTQGMIKLFIGYISEWSVGTDDIKSNNSRLQILFFHNFLSDYWDYWIIKFFFKKNKYISNYGLKLFHKADNIVEQSFFNDFTVIPSGNGTKFKLRCIPCRL